MMAVDDWWLYCLVPRGYKLMIYLLKMVISRLFPAKPSLGKFGFRFRVEVQHQGPGHPPSQGRSAAPMRSIGGREKRWLSMGFPWVFHRKTMGKC